MKKLIAAPARHRKKLLFVLFILAIVTIQGCYHYRILNTNNDPATEYRDTVMWSYAWGLVNKPQNFHVPNCPETTALDEVVFSKNFGQSFLTVITLGIVSPVRVKWKCHKPCEVITDSL
jgi:Bor protein